MIKIEQRDNEPPFTEFLVSLTPDIKAKLDAMPGRLRYPSRTEMLRRLITQYVLKYGDSRDDSAS